MALIVLAIQRGAMGVAHADQGGIGCIKTLARSGGITQLMPILRIMGRCMGKQQRAIAQRQGQLV